MFYNIVKPMRVVESYKDIKIMFEDKSGDELQTTGPKKNSKCIFKKIIFITNDRRSEHNKTLKNLEEALEGTSTELITFVADEVFADDCGSTVKLQDSQTELVIKDESNIDTLVITRLGVQGCPGCEEAIKILQDWGFFVLNPIAPAKRASNKYQTAVLLQKTGLPQPRFALLNKEILDDEENLKEVYKSIYSDWGKNEEEDESKEFVVKILDGHGGTGVFLTDGKHIMAILLAIFAINPEQQLLLQKKEEADGGDIRVHVLTLRGKQKILASMKRVKLTKDFRSNVSLGATAEPVKLTKEQEQIALKAAEVSKLPWCAVDIMPLKKGSNKEVGDNVILEFNASPGTDGISEVIKENFMELLLKEINDPQTFYIQEKTAGFREGIKIKIDDEYVEFLAKLDTGNGAKASTLGVELIALSGDSKQITFTVNGKEYTKDVIEEALVEVGSTMHHRYIVRFDEIKIGKRRLTNVKFALDEGRNKSTNVLINRDTLRKMGYVVSSDATHLLTPHQDIIRRK